MYSKEMTALQFLALLLITNPCLSCGVSPPNNASGPEVVNEVLYWLECSEVFEDDHSFMRRLAYVETKDGTAQEEKAGIWHIPEGLLTQMNASIGEYSELTDVICKRFNINISMAIRDPQNLGNARVSGVVARFYLNYVTHTKNKQIPPAEDIHGQAMFWGTHFRMSADAATINHFTSRVLELEG